MSVWSWLSGLFAPSGPAVMYRPGWTPGSKVRLYWPEFPLDVYLETESNHAYAAVDYWNGVAGKRLFNEPIPAINDVLRAFGDSEIRAYLKRAVLIRIDVTTADHGDTKEEYDKRTGEMISALVMLPGASKRPQDVANHELGHVLTLDHTRDGTLMGPRLPPTGTPVPLDEAQAKLVRSWRAG